MAAVIINSLSKVFHESVRRKGVSEEIKVLNNISLKIEDGEFVTIFGPNGCGKSTLLNIVAGLENCTNGNVLIDGLTPDKARVGYILQNFREMLLPWRKNIDNIALPYELIGMAKVERYEKVNDLLNQLGVSLPLDQYPYQLSGGQQQLVSICMAQAFKADILLMDEPFGGLSFYNRISMHEKILNIWEKAKLTTLFVSHDPEEAVFLAQRVIVLSKRPASVMEIINVDLPQPRDLAILKSSEFFELKNRLLEAAARPN